MSTTEQKTTTVYIASSVDGELIRYAASCLSSLGKVSVFATVSEECYRSLSRKELLARYCLRFLMYLWHPLRMMLAILIAPKGSHWVVTTNPFFAPSLAIALGRLRGHEVATLLYDLFPDALEEAGLIRRSGLRAKFFGYLTRFALKHGKATVFLGQQLKAHAESRWGKANRAVVIPVVMSSPVADRPSEEQAHPLVIHYGGQLGWMHDADSLVVLIRNYLDTGDSSRAVRWDFRISGAKSQYFIERFKEAAEVIVQGTLPVAEWRKLAVTFPVGLVSLSVGGGRVCLPSKVFGMMACGMAILAMCPLESDLGEMIDRHELGWVVDSSGDLPLEAFIERFVRTVDEIAASPNELLRRRQNAWDYIQGQNRLDHGAHRWSELFARTS